MKTLLIYFNKNISKVLYNFMLLNVVQNINLAVLCRDNLRVIEMFVAKENNGLNIVLFYR
ncbi:hypothetical protein [Candidatus Lariskella endosymbiont of Hedychridium roseum]|uniref:hypothetical protein n=1 Tax=Candidatus Lariskella endosymbiont of Hedychridium roseum TaxID=3077949 RepID=UPI0030D0DA0E